MQFGRLVKRCGRPALFFGRAGRQNCGTLSALAGILKSDSLTYRAYSRSIQRNSLQWEALLPFAGKAKRFHEVVSWSFTPHAATQTA